MNKELSNYVNVFAAKNKFSTVLLSVLPLVVLIAVMIFSVNQNLTIFPTNNIGYRLWAGTDQGWQGNSQIKEFVFDNQRMKLKYILRGRSADPKVFISLKLEAGGKPVDFSNYDAVTIRIKDATPKRLVVFIKTYLPGVSMMEPRYFNRLRHNQYLLQITPRTQVYTIKLKDFITPSWWVRLVKYNPDFLPAENFRRVVTFDLHFNQEGSDYRLNRREKITVESISFHRKIPPVCYGAMGLAFFYIGLLAGIFLHRRHSEVQPPILQGKNLTVISNRDKELQQVKEFIETSYASAEISTRMVAEQLGLSPARIVELLKEEYHLTFKQLINKLRINEAKRLLKETDLRITDIAINLGFNSVSYFNNLFKLYEQIPPSEYREKNHKS